MELKYMYHNIIGFGFFGLFAYFAFFNPQTNMPSPQTIWAIICGMFAMILFVMADIYKIKRELKK